MILDKQKISGVEWTCGLPSEDYQYEVRSESMECTAIPVSDAPNERYAKLLEWLHQYHVHKVPGKLVQAYEGPSFLFETMLSNQLPNGGLSFPCLVIGKRRIKQSPSNLAMRESNWDRSMTTKKRWDEACTVSSTCLHGELLAFTLELEACINIYIYKFRFFGPKKHTPRPWVHWHITRPGRVVPGSFCAFLPASCSQLSHQSPWPPNGGHSIGGSWRWGSPHSGPERLGRFFFTYRFTPKIWESNAEHLWSIYIIYLLLLPFLFFWEIWVQHTHTKKMKKLDHANTV